MSDINFNLSDETLAELKALVDGIYDLCEAEGIPFVFGAVTELQESGAMSMVNSANIPEGLTPLNIVIPRAILNATNRNDMLRVLLTAANEVHME